jgi:hypothetical protein
VDPTTADSTTTADAFLQRFLHDLGEDHRRVAPGEWGLTLECAGWPLHVGLAVRGGLVRAQAEAVGPGRLDPAELLHRNRLAVLVRYGQTRAGAVWVHGDLPLQALDEAALDRLLGLLVEAASWARYAASGGSSSPLSRRA